MAFNVALENVRLYNYAVMKPYAANPAYPARFSVRGLVSVDEPTVADLEKEIGIQIGKWETQTGQEWPASAKEPMMAAEYAIDGVEPGLLVVTATSPALKPPKVVDNEKQPLEDESTLYKGCGVKLVVEPFQYEVNGVLGVSLRLKAVRVTDPTLPRIGGKGVKAPTVDDLL